ncbi:hypothetical protein MLD38_023744 [Melastoma candidum]|uniref:Uncharacterized protein n=1 Tax=Melastoma candidum TaxID=119954 RepID=A0ACB9NWT0_9MYRT|nr:hypothetical protein MLD38_023744 [Melastoma candidum]
MIMGSYLILFSSLVMSQCYLSGGSRQAECQPAKCESNEPNVRFPFSLPSQQDQRCWYPGFNLSCDDNSRTVINLPLSGTFVVQDFYYINQTIWLRDPGDCLPQRLLELNTSGSNLMVGSYVTFALLDCPIGTAGRQLGLKRISCLSSGNYEVVAVPTEGLSVLENLDNCTHNRTLQVPSIPKDLESGLALETMALTWNLPECAKCEKHHGSCGIKDGKDRRITCSHPTYDQRLSIFEQIFIFGTPCLPLVMGFVFCISKTMQAANEDADRPSATDLEHDQHEQWPDSSTTGMDTPSIASYPKIQICENTTLSHLVKPREDMCAICLLDYRTNDTLKIIPECDHYFHEECIDRWLRTKATCPLCRKRQHHKQSLSQSD